MRRVLEFRWQRSILRRASGLLLLLLPGFALNYALLLGASRMLDVESFGIFYTAISIVNLFFMPAVIVGSFFVYDVAAAASAGGTQEALQLYRRNLRLTVKWGLGLTVVLVTGFGALSVVANTNALPLFAMILITTYSSYFIECLRSCLQGIQRFRRLGVVGLSWMAGRFALGLAGIYVLGTAWGGMAGVGLAGILVFLFAHQALARENASKGPVPAMDQGAAKRLLVFVVSYGVFPVAAYLDILLAYFVLPSASLGAYTASSVLPKALILAAAPIVQVMFPVLIADRAKSENHGLSLSKGLLFTGCFTVFAVVSLVILDDLTCGGSIGIKNCMSDLLFYLGVSSIALCLIRVLVLHNLAAGNYWHSLLLVVPGTSLLAVTLLSPQEPGLLAYNYMIFCIVALAGYAIASLEIRELLLPTIARVRGRLFGLTRG